MPPTVTLRPNKTTLVRGLPFKEHGGNYRLLKSIRGPGTREAQWNPERKRFEVPRANSTRLIEGLVEEFGAIRLVVYGHAQTACVRACWDAKPSTAPECVCSCAAANHGTGHPIGPEVAEGLSVAHEYTKATYEVDANGWHLVV